VNYIRAKTARVEAGEFIVTAGSSVIPVWATYVTCPGCIYATLSFIWIAVGYIIM
jgi:hypothetical protein